LGFANTRSLIVEWGDCDPAGIVFYPRFFAMFDTSTARLIEAAAGRRKAEILRHYDIVGWPMVNTRGQFHSPARYGDEVTIASTVVRVGGASFDIEHRLTLGEKLCAEGWETRVWARRDPANTDGIISQSLPKNLRTVLAGAGA
jgi:4-hydroxybenzoyl-CoA thioesterase